MANFPWLGGSASITGSNPGAAGGVLTASSNGQLYYTTKPITGFGLLAKQASLDNDELKEHSVSKGGFVFDHMGTHKILYYLENDYISQSMQGRWVKFFIIPGRIIEKLSMHCTQGNDHFYKCHQSSAECKLCDAGLDTRDIHILPIIAISDAGGIVSTGPLAADESTFSQLMTMYGPGAANTTNACPMFCLMSGEELGCDESASMTDTMWKYITQNPIDNISNHLPTYNDLLITDSYKEVVAATVIDFPDGSTGLQCQGNCCRNLPWAVPNADGTFICISCSLKM